MNFDLQPLLEDDLLKVTPLKEHDFEELYKVASDPLVWEQHPNKNRYQRAVFHNFFKGAIESGGAFLVTATITGEVIGSSRYYELDEKSSSIAVGYTFIGRNYWGKGYNTQLKKLMFNHAFQYVNQIILHIGENNFRSQKAAEKIGAIKVGEINIAYYGEPVKLNFIYQMTKQEWLKLDVNEK